MSREALRKTTEAELLPWQREVGLAYRALMKAQEELSMTDRGAEDEEEKRMNVWRRTKNLVGVLNVHYPHVKRIPDALDITPKGIEGKVFYFTDGNEVKAMGISKWSRRPDFEHAEEVPDLTWAADVRLTSTIREALMDLIPGANKEVIVNAVKPVPEQVELI